MNSHEKRLFGESLPLPPMKGKGLTKELERLWFERLEFARKRVAELPKGRTLAKWLGIVEHCRAFIAGSNTGLVLLLAGRSFSRGRLNQRSRDEIESGAYFGLLRAVDKFEIYRRNPRSKKSYRFSTYAWIAIKKGIVSAVNSERKVASRFVAESAYFKSQQGERSDGTTNYEFGGTPSPEDDTIATPDNLEALELAMKTSKLTAPELMVLDLRFRQGLLLHEAGAQMGVTKEWVRQLQERALKKLRETMALQLEGTAAA